MSHFRAPAPRSLPIWQIVLDGLPAGAGTDEALAAFLDVTPRTVARWKRQGTAPRAVILALFWETKWGISHHETDAYNAARQSAQEARVYRHEVERLAGVVARLETEHDWGSANSPIFNLPRA